MTHEELLFGIKEIERLAEGMWGTKVLRAVVELHKPQEITLPNGEWGANCVLCDGWYYPCQTIATIEKALQ